MADAVWQRMTFYSISPVIQIVTLLYLQKYGRFRQMLVPPSTRRLVVEFKLHAGHTRPVLVIIIGIRSRSVQYQVCSKYLLKNYISSGSIFVSTGAKRHGTHHQSLVLRVHLGG